MKLTQRVSDWLERHRSSRFVLLVGVAMALKALLVRWLALGHALGPGAIADVAFILAVALFVSLLEGRLARRGMAVLDVIFSIGCVAVVLYVSYFGQLPTTQTFALSSQAHDLGDDVSALLSWVHVLLIIDIPFVLWRSFRAAPERRPRKRRFAFGIVALLLVAAFCAVAVVNPLAQGALANSYQYGIVPYEVAAMVHRPAAKAAAPKSSASLQKQIDQLTGRAYAGRKTNAPAAGAYQGDSLIMIQVEALQEGLVGARIEGQPIVPNLEALIARSNFYPNTYSQIGRGNTSDAEFIANTSLYPSVEQASCLAYAKKKIPSLPRLLNDKGYSTITFHTNNASFWNRFQLYPALGFSDFADRQFFGDEDVIGYGPSDAVLYRNSLPIIMGEVSQGRPVYAQLVTLSSHHPFNAFAGHGPLKLSPRVANTITGRYLQAEAYQDQQLGVFLAKANEYKLLDHAVLVVYGDHFGMRFTEITDEDKAIRAQLLGRTYNKADFYNIPLVIHMPKQTAGVVDQGVTGQIDIMPSVADLLGVSLAKTPHFGRSVFVNTPTMLTRPSGIPTFISDTQMYLGGVTAGEDRWYSPTGQDLSATGGTVPANLGNTTKLLELSESYANALPERLSTVDAEGYVPTKDLDVSTTPFK